MNKIPIFCKIQIWHLEQFTITQITSSVQECGITRGCKILSLERIQITSETPEKLRWKAVANRRTEWPRHPGRSLVPGCCLPLPAALLLLGSGKPCRLQLQMAEGVSRGWDLQGEMDSGFHLLSWFSRGLLPPPGCPGEAGEGASLPGKAKTPSVGQVGNAVHRISGFQPAHSE